jgi:hypothetical protein
LERGRARGGFVPPFARSERRRSAPDGRALVRAFPPTGRSLLLLIEWEYSPGLAKKRGGNSLPSARRERSPLRASRVSFFRGETVLEIAKREAMDSSNAAEGLSWYLRRLIRIVKLRVKVLLGTGDG